jgi:hypothetical protein
MRHFFTTSRCTRPSIIVSITLILLTPRRKPSHHCQGLPNGSLVPPMRALIIRDAWVRVKEAMTSSFHHHRIIFTISSSSAHHLHVLIYTPASFALLCVSK